MTSGERRVGDVVRVALVTSRDLPELCPDDRVLLAHLTAFSYDGADGGDGGADGEADGGADGGTGGAGGTGRPGSTRRAHERTEVEVAVEVWDDPGTDWGAFDVVVIRSTWDYADTPDRRDDYVAWARDVERAGAVLFTPSSVVEENTHKRYLLELAAEEVPIVPTILLERGARVDLQTIVDKRGWRGLVVKPAVGAGGRDTFRCDVVDAAACARVAAALERSLAKEDMLVQPFMDAVLEEGEVSYNWIDGRFTHAVRKRASPGEFRVQDDHGGTVEAVPMWPEWLRVAEAAMAPFVDEVRYGRVDLVAGADGRPLVMEVELVEPELFFRFDEGSVRRFAEAVVDAAIERGT